MIKRPDLVVDPLLRLLKVLVPGAQIPFSLQQQDFPAAVGRPHRFAFGEVPCVGDKAPAKACLFERMI